LRRRVFRLLLAGVLSLPIVISSWLLAAWLLRCSRCNTIIIKLARNSIMIGNNQTNLRSNTSLTQSFFSTSQYHHSSRHDDLEQYGTTTSTLYLKVQMFGGATSFNQDLSSWDISAAAHLGLVSGLGP
jgi:hypothetical protein